MLSQCEVGVTHGLHRVSSRAGARPALLLQGSVSLLISGEDTPSLKDHLCPNGADLPATAKAGPLALTLPDLLLGPSRALPHPEVLPAPRHPGPPAHHRGTTVPAATWYCHHWRLLPSLCCRVQAGGISTPQRNQKQQVMEKPDQRREGKRFKRPPTHSQVCITLASGAQ